MEGKIISVAIICFLIGFIIGMIVTADIAVHKATYLTQVLMNDGTLNITYDDEVLESLIRRYLS